MKRVLLMFVATLSLATPVYAQPDDRKLLLDYMAKDADGSQCTPIRRIINQTVQIPIEQLVFYAIAYEDDCAYEEASKLLPLPKSSALALTSFIGFTTYENARAQTGEWYKTFGRVMHFGYPKIHIPELLNQVLWSCSKKPYAIEGVNYLIDAGFLAPDYPVPNGLAGTLRQQLTKACPNAVSIMETECYPPGFRPGALRTCKALPEGLKPREIDPNG